MKTEWKMKIKWKKVYSGVSIDSWDISNSFERLGTIVRVKERNEWDSCSFKTGNSSPWGLTRDQAISFIIDEANRAKAA